MPRPFTAGARRRNIDTGEPTDIDEIPWEAIPSTEPTRKPKKETIMPPPSSKKPPPAFPVATTAAIAEPELTPEQRAEIKKRVDVERAEARREKRLAEQRERLARGRAVRAQNLKDRKEQEKRNRADLEAAKKKMNQGKIGRAGLPAIKPLGWLKQFRSEYEVTAEDLRRMCMAFIFGHSIDELKLMTSAEHRHEIPVIVYVFARGFIEESEAGRSDAVERLLDRIYGKSVQKELVINANLDLGPKTSGDAAQRKAELERLEREVAMLTAGDAEIAFKVVGNV